MTTFVPTWREIGAGDAHHGISLEVGLKFFDHCTATLPGFCVSPAERKEYSDGWKMASDYLESLKNDTATDTRDFTVGNNS